MTLTEVIQTAQPAAVKKPARSASRKDKHGPAAPTASTVIQPVVAAPLPPPKVTAAQRKLEQRARKVAEAKASVAAAAAAVAARAAAAAAAAAARVVAPPSAVAPVDPLFEHFNRMNGSQLSHLLGINDQLKSGSKSELVARCMDRKMFGNLPRCPVCGGGKLKERGSGRFFCPGFYDDADYRFCGYSCASHQVQRLAWKDYDA